jgi:hypothetical protein
LSRKKNFFKGVKLALIAAWWWKLNICATLRLIKKFLQEKLKGMAGKSNVDTESSTV